MTQMRTDLEERRATKGNNHLTTIGELSFSLPGGSLNTPVNSKIHPFVAFLEFGLPLNTSRSPINR